MNNSSESSRSDPGRSEWGGESQGGRGRGRGRGAMIQHILAQRMNDTRYINEQVNNNTVLLRNLFTLKIF